MSSVKSASPRRFQGTASERLSGYLETTQNDAPAPIVSLTPDASTREYFRVPWKQRTAVAAVYPEPFDAEVHPYLDVTRLFLAADVPVPDIYAIDGERGIIVQEDLGDQQLFRFFESASEEESEEYKE